MPKRLWTRDEMILTLALYFQLPAFLEGKKMMDYSGVKTQRLGDKFIVDKAFIIGDIGVNSEAGIVDKIAIINPDDIHFMDTGGQKFKTSPVEIIAGAVREKRQDVP